MLWRIIILALCVLQPAQSCCSCAGGSPAAARKSSQAECDTYCAPKKGTFDATKSPPCSSAAASFLNLEAVDEANKAKNNKMLEAERNRKNSQKLILV